MVNPQSVDLPFEIMPAILENNLTPTPHGVSVTIVALAQEHTSGIRATDQVAHPVPLAHRTVQLPRIITAPAHDLVTHLLAHAVVLQSGGEYLVMVVGLVTRVFRRTGLPVRIVTPALDQPGVHERAGVFVAQLHCHRLEVEDVRVGQGWWHCGLQ